MSLPVFPSFTKHPKLWFDDGNIVIAAQDTGFRLHKGVLAAKSSVMKTLFSLSQPTDAEKYEDLDVVRFEDEAAELEQFFNFLYNFSNHLLDRRIPEWKEVKVLLGLGSKYEANDARREAIRLIRSVVPHSAEEWYKAFPGQKGLMRSNHTKDYIDMANTTYKHGLHRTHLGCLYRCCQLPTKDLLYGTPGGDGSLTCLPSEHLISCLEARPKLVRAHCNILEDVWNILPSEYCTTPSHCDPAIRNLCSPRFQDVYLMTDPIMLLWPGKLRVDKGDLLPGLCEYCREDAAEVLQAGRQEIFENIHRYFGKTKAQVDME